MFNKVKCNHCENEYDETFSECPKCHAVNESLDPNFKNIQMISWPKQLSLFLMGLAGFNLLAVLVSLIMLRFDVSNLDRVLVNMLLNAICYTILFIVLFAIINVDIKKLLKSFGKWEPYIAGLCCCVIMLLFQILYTSILINCGVNFGNNANQGEINATSNSYPLLSFIIFGLIGPVCEELTYRVGLFSFMKRISKWLAYPVTILIFALIHFDFSGANLVNELINLPIYIFAGFAFSYTYDKFGFAGSTFAHILNNVISLLPPAILGGVFFR